MGTDEEKLVVDNMNLANKFAWDYYKKFQALFEFDDIQAICYYGLVKAAKTYKAETKFTFSTYAVTVIKNEILYYFRQNKKHLNNISLSEPLDNDDLELEDHLALAYNLTDEVENKLDIDNLYKYIDSLSDRHQFILKHKLQGCTFDKIGEMLGLSQPQISRDYQKALNILRNKFERGGI